MCVHVHVHKGVVCVGTRCISTLGVVMREVCVGLHEGGHEEGSVFMSSDACHGRGEGGREGGLPPMGERETGGERVLCVLVYMRGVGGEEGYTHNSLLKGRTGGEGRTGASEMRPKRWLGGEYRDNHTAHSGVWVFHTLTPLVGAFR